MKNQMMLILAIIALDISNPAIASADKCENSQAEIDTKIEQGLDESEHWRAYLDEFNERVPNDCTIIGNEPPLPRP